MEKTRHAHCASNARQPASRHIAGRRARAVHRERPRPCGVSRIAERDPPARQLACLRQLLNSVDLNGATTHTHHLRQRQHRLTRITSTSTSGEQFVYALDNAGNVEREELVNASAVSGTASVLRRDFDALGRLWHEIHNINGLDQTTTYGHDANGNPTTTQWPAVPAYGEASAPQELRRYNALNQLSQIEDAANGAAKPTVLTPDARDLITRVKAPNNASTGYSFDGLGQLTSETSPDAGPLSQTYDAAGNLKTRLDARGVTESWSYDALNRPTAITYTRPNSSDTSDDQNYTWDNNPGGPIPCSNGVGRLCRLSDAGGA